MQTQLNISLSAKIKAKAHELGFYACGISRSRFLEEEAPRLENYLRAKRHGGMQYMENYFDKRLNPSTLVPETKSVISVLYNYYTPKKQVDTAAPIFSKYAYGKDYHPVLKDKLNQLLAFIRTEAGDVNGRAFVDSAPVLEKAWARLSGLGWLGKNGLLITRQAGSFFFIGELLVDIELGYDHAGKDYCGTCTRCIDACPTQAIVAPQKIDANKCISYLTIEFKGEIPKKFKGKFKNRAFGCDICQDVCPYNQRARAHNEPLFEPHPLFLNMTREEWQKLDEATFREMFRKSPVKRSKYAGLKRNIDFL